MLLYQNRYVTQQMTSHAMRFTQNSMDPGISIAVVSERRMCGCVEGMEQKFGEVGSTIAPSNAVSRKA